MSDTENERLYLEHLSRIRQIISKTLPLVLLISYDRQDQREIKHSNSPVASRRFRIYEIGI